MDKQQFVTAVNARVVAGSVEGLKQILLQPPGREPHKDLVEESNWFKSLNEEDKAMVEKIIIRSVEQATFTFLCILDGVSAIEDGPNKGILKLVYEKDGKQVRLNDEDSDYLHDLM